MRRQLAYVLGRHRAHFRTGDEALDALVRNSTLSELFLALARDLQVLEPKTPEDIYKSHLDSGGARAGSLAAAAPELPSRSATRSASACCPLCE